MSRSPSSDRRTSELASRGARLRSLQRTYDIAVDNEDKPNLQRKPRPAERVVSQQTDESAVLLDLGSGEYFSLEGLGAEIWVRCQKEATVAEIIQALESGWDVPREILEADVVEFVEELHSAGLIDYA